MANKTEAIECARLLPEVNLQPYWIVLTSSLVFTIVPVVLSSLRRRYEWCTPRCRVNCCLKMKKHSRGCGDYFCSVTNLLPHELRSVRGPNVDISITQNLEDRPEDVIRMLERLEDLVEPQTRVWLGNFYFSLVNLIYQTVFLTYLVMNAIHTSKVDLSGWEIYQAIYFRFLNGGIVNLFATVCLSRIAQHNLASNVKYLLYTLNQEQYFPLTSIDAENAIMKRRSDWLSFFTGLLILPACVSHALPIGFAYLWAVSPFFFLTMVIVDSWDDTRDGKFQPFFPDSLCSMCTRKILQATDSCGANGIASKLTLQFLCSICVTTMFNWGMLLYRGENYIEVIVHEFNLRDTSCWISALQDSVYNRVVALGLL